LGKLMIGHTCHFVRKTVLSSPCPRRHVQRADGVAEHLGERGRAGSELIVNQHAMRSRGNGAPVVGGVNKLFGHGKRRKRELTRRRCYHARLV
jgi:hypothetical protein